MYSETAQITSVPSYPDPYMPGINQTYDSAMQPPALTQNQSWWDSLKEFGSDFDVSYGIEKSYETVSHALGTVTRDLAHGIAETTETLVKPVEDVTSFAVWQVVLLVGVLGVALYYTGKSGGLRVSV